VHIPRQKPLIQVPLTPRDAIIKQGPSKDQARSKQGSSKEGARKQQRTGQELVHWHLEFAVFGIRGLQIEIWITPFAIWNLPFGIWD